MKASITEQYRLGNLGALLLLSLIGACSQHDVSLPLAKIAAGDSVVLDKHALACKHPSSELGLIAGSKGGARDDLIARIGHREDCYDTAEFLVNGQWQVLAVNDTQLRIQMRDYLGEYWVSRAQISPGNVHTETGPTVAKPVVPAAPVTVEEWRRSLGTAYEQTQIKNPGDGVTTFMAMFPKKGGVGAFGEHDAFNKAYLFKPFNTQLDWNLGPSVRCYVLVLEGASPVVVVSPLYWSRDGYISLRKLAILVDGELLFERAFQASDIKRGRYGVGVNETVNIVLSGDALQPFRKITKESTIAIRLTGDSAYVNLKKDGIDPIASFRRSVIDSLFIYDSIGHATAGHLPKQEPTQQ